MRMTLLEMTQSILSKTSSDEINSIGDTVESLQVANEIMVTYNHMMANLDWPHRYTLVSFESSVDTARPTHMRIMNNVDKLRDIYYNNGTTTAPDYKPVTWIEPSEFISVSQNNTTGSSILVVQDYSGAYFTIKTNKHPQCCTSFDDEYIIFDSYKNDVDSTLQESKIMALGQVIPTFTLDDNYTPDMPDKYFPWLLAEATAACFFYNRQMSSPIDEKRARDQLVRHQNNRYRYDRYPTSGSKGPDFGRRT